MGFDEAGTTKALNLRRNNNYETVMVQLTGEQSANACESCIAGLGPFSGCFRHPGLAKGVCGNCHYNSEGTILGREVDGVGYYTDPSLPPSI